jgi:hypothetical protein
VKHIQPLFVLVAVTDEDLGSRFRHFLKQMSF